MQACYPNGRQAKCVELSLTQQQYDGFVRGDPGMERSVCKKFREKASWPSFVEAARLQLTVLRTVAAETPKAAAQDAQLAAAEAEAREEVAGRDYRRGQPPPVDPELLH